MIISDLNSIVKGMRLSQFNQILTFTFFLISRDGGRNSRPKHVAYMRNK